MNEKDLFASLGIKTKLDELKEVVMNYYVCSEKAWVDYFKHNPYIATKVFGIGFVKADAMAMKLGFKKDAIERIIASVSHCLENENNGNTIISIRMAINSLTKLLEIDRNKIRNAIYNSKGSYLLLNSELKESSNENEIEFITLKSWLETEKGIFNMCKKSSECKKIDKEKINNAIKHVQSKLKFPLNEMQEKALNEIPYGNMVILTGLGGCLPHDTEVLTPNGWIEISKWKDEKIMEVEIKKDTNDQSRKSFFRKPLKFYKLKTDQFYQFKTNGGTLDLITSEQHIHPTVTGKGFNRTKCTKEIYDEYKENIDKDKIKNIASIPETFEWFGDGLNYSDEYIRLKVCIFADGYFSKDRINRPNHCCVNIKKERKKNRMKWLLEINNIKYKIYKSAPQYERFSFDVDNTDKEFSLDWFIKSNKRQREIIIDELIHWDGSKCAGNRFMKFSTCSEVTMNTIQLIGTSLGYRCNIREDKRSEKYKGGVCYDLTFSKNKYSCKTLESSSSVSIEKVESGDFMYCFTTETGYFLIRQKGKIYITGNCGKTYLLKTVLDVFDKIGEKYSLLAPTGTASKVLTNSTGRFAQTIHRAYFTGCSIKENEWIIVDESSMLSLDHFKYLLSMTGGRNVKVMFVGDNNQITPISVGLPFSDIQNLVKIGSLNGKIFELTEIMRAKSDSGIPYVSKMLTKFDKYNSGVEYEQLNGVKFYDIENNINKQIEDIIKDNNLDINETYVLTAKKNGKAGVNEINDHLQSVFNEQDIIFKDKFKTYKIGDKVMHTKNNNKIDVFNGEILTIKGYYKNNKELFELEKVDDKEIVIYDYETLQQETMLAYSFSVHKSQGATLKNVICVFPKSHSFMISRNLAYTAVSRASTNLFIIKERDILEKSYNKNEIVNRKTFLNEFLKIKLNK